MHSFAEFILKTYGVNSVFYPVVIERSRRASFKTAASVLRSRPASASRASSTGDGGCNRAAKLRSADEPRQRAEQRLVQKFVAQPGVDILRERILHWLAGLSCLALKVMLVLVTYDVRTNEYRDRPPSHPSRAQYRNGYTPTCCVAPLAGA